MHECPTGKVPHETRDDATRDAMRMNLQPVLHGAAVAAEPYLCRQCGQWHSGRPE